MDHFALCRFSLRRFHMCIILLCCLCLSACGNALPRVQASPTSLSQAGKLLHAYSDHLFASMIAWSPDGKHVAVQGEERSGSYEVQVWNIASGKQEQAYLESQFVSNGPELAWSPDGRQIASGGDVVAIWNVSTGRTQSTYTGSTTGFHVVNALAWSPDGTHIALAGARGSQPDQVQVWNKVTGQLVWEAEMLDRIRVVAWSANRRWLAVASETTLQLRDANTGKLMKAFNGYTGVITDISWSPDSAVLASAESGGTVRLREVLSGQSQPFFSTHGTEPIIFVAWSPKGRYLAFSAIDDTVQIWDTSTKRRIATCSDDGKNSAMALAWSPDGTMLASADTSTIEGLQIWRAIP